MAVILSDFAYQDAYQQYAYQYGDPLPEDLNPNAIYYPSQYEICDRTGFRVPAGTLRREWNGLMVRPESWERRHPQDFVRSRPEHHRGSPRPEQPDTFVPDSDQVGVDDL